MYSVNATDKLYSQADEGKQTPEPAKQHQDISPELKEVMHLLQMIETGKNKK